MKKIMMLLIVAIFILAGCSEKSNDFVYVGPYVPFDPNDSIIATELENNSGISVEYQVLADVLTLEKVSLDLSSQSDIDIMKVPLDVYNYLVENNQLLELNSYLEDYGQNIINNIPQEIWETVDVNGSIYGIPSYTSDSYVENVIFYNKNYITEVPSSIAEFQNSTCEVASNNTELIALDFNSLLYNVEIISSYFDINYNEAEFFQTEEFKSYAEYIKSLVDCGAIDMNTVNSGIDNKISQFKMGNTAYLVAPFWYILQIGSVEGAKENYGVIWELDGSESIKNEQVTYMTVIPSYKSEEAVEIMQYLNYLFSTEIQMTLLLGEKGKNYSLSEDVLTIHLDEENKYQNGWWYLPGNISLPYQIQIEYQDNIYSLEQLRKDYNNAPDPNDYNYYVVMDQLFDIVESELILYLIEEQSYDEMVNSIVAEIEYLQSV